MNCGLAALVIAPGLDNPANATPTLLASGTVPVAVSLSLIVGILSAAVSTLDSIALTLGAMVARDLMRQGAGRDARQIFIGRVVVVLVVLFAAAFAVREAAIVDQLAALSAAELVVTVPATIGAFFWQRGTAGGVIASLVGGAATAIWMATGGQRERLRPHARVRRDRGDGGSLRWREPGHPPAPRRARFQDDAASRTRPHAGLVIV